MTVHLSWYGVPRFLSLDEYFLPMLFIPPSVILTSFFFRHSLSFRSGDLGRPPLAEVFIRTAGHQYSLLPAVVAAVVVLVLLLLAPVVAVLAVVLRLSPRSSRGPR